MRTNAEPRGGRSIAAVATALLRVVVFYVFSAVFIPIVILVALVNPGSSYYSLVRFWAWLGLKIFAITTVVDGLGKLDSHQDYVVMANHRSHFDVLVIIDALRDRQTRWVAKRELLKVPIFGTGLRVTGQIVINRDDHDQAIRTLRESMRNRGVSVVFFPEGHRAATTELLPFKKGAAAFAIDAGLPVVPVAVAGSERVLPTQSWLVHPGTIRVIIGDVIDVSSMTAHDRESLTAAARDAVVQLLRGPDQERGTDKKRGVRDV